MKNRHSIYPLIALLAGASSLLRADVPIYPGPSYENQAGTGNTNAEVYDGGVSLNTGGQAVGVTDKFVSGVFKGNRAVTWNGSGSALELGLLGTDSNGVGYSVPTSISNTQLITGISTKYVGGVNKGDRAVRWDVDGNVLELQNIGVGVDGVATGGAMSINASGISVGYAEQFVLGLNNGIRPVRWDFNGAATELNVLNTTPWNQGNGRALSINLAGQVTGFSEKFSDFNSLGLRPVRWTNFGVISELPTLGSNSAGQAYGRGLVINVNGNVVGWSQKFVGGVDKGQRAVLWNQAGNILELGNLGESLNGYSFSTANHINDAGESVGVSEKYTAGVDLGSRAVRWDISGNVTELSNLGTSGAGITNSEAYSINSNGQIAGYAEKYVSGVFQGNRAMVWQSDGSAIDLNSLIANSNKWVLNVARNVTSTGWVSGVGTFDPDETGPLPAYSRLFTIKITNDVVWTNSAGGAWHTDSNWSTGFAPGTELGTTFNLPGSYTVSFGSDAQIGSIVQTAGTVTYALAGRTLTSSGQINIAGGQIIINGGTVKASAVLSSAPLTLNSGATLEITSPGDETGVSVVKQLVIPQAGSNYAATIQLHNNDLIVDYLGGLSQYESIIDMVRSGLVLLGGNGTGIASDLVDSQSIPGTFLGVVDNGLIDGQITSVSGFNDFSPDSVIVKFTWLGDANLDGVVDGSDYALLDTGHFDTSLKGWVYGDFDYSGVIDGSDYALIDTGFLSQNGTLPEPTMLCIPLILGQLLLTRRSRHFAR